MVHCWICGTVEWDMNVKVDNTTEFVTLLNEMYVTGTLLNMLKTWIWYENVKLDNTTEFVHCWIGATVEWDENVKRDNTIDFVAPLNMWDRWMKLDSWIR